ncbi:ATP-binding protein [Spirulina sp. CCNP1310]|uniref:GAF domain-containing sensor histidine kinase n=1 Tax=Spirulina sp. CCNP1310 TaxID=3110249 RepID=UPI002B200D67|nr:ATP-binding protein [Spirulina sp. CCNP1310]MEA5419776.1 ATP-binding protein [Spirulina sp. CCNP1310]
MNIQTPQGLALDTLPQEPDAHVKVDELLNRISRRILQSLSLENTLTVTAAEVRDFLGVDRIKIYKFAANGDGQVVAEALDGDRLPSLLGLNFPADDIPAHARELFMKARMRSIVNVDTGKIGQGCVHNPGTSIEIPEDIRFRPLDPCHQEYLTAMGVKASLVVPIPDGNRAWGLLVGHHSESWTVSETRLRGVQMVVDQLAVAIAQANLWQATQEKAQREAIIHHISQQLHSITAMDLEAALATTVEKLSACGGRLFLNRTILESYLDNPAAAIKAPSPLDTLAVITVGLQPVIPPGQRFTAIEQSHAWQNFFPQQSQPSWSTINVYLVPQLRNIQPAFRSTAIRGLLIAPLYLEQQPFGYLTLFRDEIATETLWAGEFNPDERQVQPRLSFEVWKESIHGQCHPWTTSDHQLIEALSEEFASGIQQHHLYHLSQRVNASLEEQIQDRTAKLQTALTKLSQTHLQLTQAEKMSSLGQLITGVCHEIHNPINFIAGNLSHAQHYFDDVFNLVSFYQQMAPSEIATALQSEQESIDLDFIAEDFPNLIASMQTGIDRIQTVVRSLLHFSHHEQSELKAMDLHNSLNSILLILHYRTKPKSDTPGITIEKFYGDLPLVDCYGGQFNQVLINLLNNAIQAIEARWQGSTDPQPGRIEITTTVIELEDQRPQVVVKIEDNGCGMPDRVRAHIFEPFFTTKTQGQGTGLGLSISNQIITEQHHGSLTCRSILGQGTAMTIQIPIHQPAKMI